MSYTITANDLSAFPLFEGIAPDALETITAEIASPVVYTKGDAIYRTDTFRHAIGLILSGSVTIRTPEAVMMNRLRCGAMFGAAALFDDADTYVTHITAEEPTVIAFLSQEQISSWLVSYPQLAENYIRFLSGRIRFLNRKLSILTTGTAEARVYQYLLAQQDEHGTVRMPRSMVELANTLNIGRSSLYRAIDSLQQAGVLRHEGREYRLMK